MIVTVNFIRTSSHLKKIAYHFPHTSIWLSKTRPTLWQSFTFPKSWRQSLSRKYTKSGTFHFSTSLSVLGLSDGSWIEQLWSCWNHLHTTRIVCWALGYNLFLSILQRWLAKSEWLSSLWSCRHFCPKKSICSRAERKVPAWTPEHFKPGWLRIKRRRMGVAWAQYRASVPGFAFETFCIYVLWKNSPRYAPPFLQLRDGNVSGPFLNEASFFQAVLYTGTVRDKSTRALPWSGPDTFTAIETFILLHSLWVVNQYVTWHWIHDWLCSLDGGQRS